MTTSVSKYEKTFTQRSLLWNSSSLISYLPNCCVVQWSKQKITTERGVYTNPKSATQYLGVVLIKTDQCVDYLSQCPTLSVGCQLQSVATAEPTDAGKQHESSGWMGLCNHRITELNRFLCHIWHNQDTLGLERTSDVFLQGCHDSSTHLCKYFLRSTHRRNSEVLYLEVVCRSCVQLSCLYSIALPDRELCCLFSVGCRSVSLNWRLMWS